MQFILLTLCDLQLLIQYNYDFILIKLCIQKIKAYFLKLELKDKKWETINFTWKNSTFPLNSWGKTDNCVECWLNPNCVFFL